MLNTNNASLNVFVTAATSSLGRETIRQLVERGHRVTGVTKGSDGATQLRKLGALPAYSDPFRSGELKSIINMAGADVVVNLLPQEGNCFPHKGLDTTRQVHVISDGTAALLEAAQDSSARFIVHLSSAEVYGDRHGEWVDETALVKGAGALERAARRAEETVLSGSIPTAVLRAGTVYGAHDPGMKFLGEAIRRGRSIYLGNPHAYRNWIHEFDLARAVILAAEKQTAGEVFNIVDDKPASATEFVSAMAKSLDLPAPTPLTAPPFLLPRLTSAAQRELLNLSVRMKHDKAKAALGWMPRYSNFQSGIDQVLMVWRAEMVVA